MRKIAVILVAAAVAGLALAGCSKPAEKPADSPAPGQQATPAAQAFSAKSADGKLAVQVKVSGKVAMVEMTIPNFTWVAPPATDPKNEADQGHAVLTLDSKEPKTVSSVRTSLADLESGKHTLKVQLMNNDKTPMNIETSIEFEVK